MPSTEKDNHDLGTIRCLLGNLKVETVCYRFHKINISPEEPTLLHSVVLLGNLLNLRKGKKNQVNRTSANLLKALIHDWFKERTKG